MHLPPIFRVLYQKNISLPTNARILDFGCGAGNTVQKLCELGFNAYGVDINFKDGQYVQALIAQGRLKKINDDGSLPFSDDYFDIIFSEQVLEHVQDHYLVAREISRVLKVNAYSIHKFPSRLRPIESHRYVPFSSIIRRRSWLTFWVILGFHMSTQRKEKVNSIVTESLHYLDTKTNYLKGKEIKHIFGKYFTEVEYADFAWLMSSPNRRGRLLARASYFFPFIPWIYRIFWSRVLFLRK